MYAVDDFGLDSDSDPDYENSNSDFCFSYTVFVEPAPEEAVVIAEPGEATGIMINIEKVVGIEKRLYMDK